MLPDIASRLTAVVGAVLFIGLASLLHVDGASAYTVPSGLGSNTTLCGPRPSDLSTAVASPVPVSGSPSLAAGATSTSTSMTGGGTVTALVVAFGSGNASIYLQTQGSGGTWVGFADVSANSADGYMATVTVDSPPGPLRAVVGNNGSSTQTVYYAVTQSTAEVGSNYTAQELADACQLAVANQSQTHADLAAILAAQNTTNSKLAALDTDLGSTGTIATNQQTMLTKLTTLDADLKTLDVDLNVGTGQAHADATWVTARPVSATLSTQDRTLAADIESSLHNDLWLLMGVLVGLAVAFEILRRVLPSGGQA